MKMIKDAFLIVIILASILALAQAAPVKGGDWTSFTLNNNNTRYQSNSTINASNVGGLSQNWFINAHDPVTSTPMVQEGNVYFSDWGGNVYSANILTGNLNWRINLGQPISSTPLVYNGIVYIGQGPGNGPTVVYALSQATGSILWSTTLKTTSKSIYGSPIIYKNLLYIGVSADTNDNETNDSTVGSIFALNAITGKVVWNFITMIGNTGGDGVWGSVVVDPNLNSIYFGTSNPYINVPNANTLYGYSIMSLNATNGRLNWYYQVYNSITIGQDRDFGSTPNLFTMSVGGVTYNAVGLGNKDGKYYIFNRVNGALLKTYTVGLGDIVGILGLAGVIYPNGPNNPELFIPSHYDSANSSGEGGTLEALYPSNGVVAWKFFTPGTLIGSVAVVPGAVLFGDDLGNLYALSTSDGTLLFQTKFNNSIEGGITAAEGYVLVPTSFGTSPPSGVYALSVHQQQNQTAVQEMTDALQNDGFTNVTNDQSIASISAPAVMFFAFDPNAQGTNLGGNTLVFALPLGDEYTNWNQTNPTVFDYLNQQNSLTLGTITFDTVPANEFYGGGFKRFWAMDHMEGIDACRNHHQ